VSLNKIVSFKADLCMKMNTKVGENIYECSILGAENPNIVFINGFRMNMNSWSKIVPELLGLGTSFTYNRLSVGKSSKARRPQTAQIIVEELRTLLSKNEIGPPYVLVGHSLGGLYTNLFARLYTTEVSAVVLVDSAHPDEHDKQVQFKPPKIIHLINEGIKSIQRIVDPYVFSEHQYVHETKEQISSVGSFPDIPLAVVSGTKKMPFVPEESFNTHLEFQKMNLKLSSNSKQYLAADSGHFPQITEPDVVVSAIKDVTKQLKAS